MGKFLCISVAIGLLFSVMLVSASPSASNSSTDGSKVPHGMMIEFITADHIFYAGANGACTIKCEAHDLMGTSPMGTVDLRMGEQETWTKIVDANGTGPDSIRCQFTWTSRGKIIDYNLYSANQEGRIQSLVTLWTVTEVGLFQLSDSDQYSLVIGWSVI